MKVEPIAFDSFGVRSMCTVVKTKDVKLVIDPSVALAPKRFGLPPHEIELRRKDELWKRIKDELELAEVVIITHYHYDHHNPNEPEVLNGKVVLVKHPNNAINLSQKKRSRYFLSLLNAKIEFADSRRFEFGNTIISFSDPVPHGKDDRLGYVLEVLIEEDESFLFTSDVEGMPLDDHVKFILDSNPDTLFLDGPMTYMPHVFGRKLFERSMRNIKIVMEKTKVKRVVLDHHLLRDVSWRDKVSEIFEFGKELGIFVQSASGFIGKEEILLEARRKELYETLR
ncbi:MAG: hypothetical protein DRP01_10350 [Archaeoglobales archaeon]|nr:MAG: hypothetical protein DRP01_10350 [Archaeoglobales archaeon]